jgi:hypothetical protein
VLRTAERRTVTHVSDGYWLRNCHGFRVETPRGRLGIVEDVLYGAEHDESAALAVSGEKAFRSRRSTRSSQAASGSRSFPDRKDAPPSLGEGVRDDRD